MRDMRMQVGIGIIGYGYWGANYVRVFNEMPETRVVAVCDKLGERLVEVQRRYPGTTVTSQIDELLSHPDIDGVVVCTEAASHYGAAASCIASGKHVLIEKPVTTKVEDAHTLVAFAESRNVTLLVGHTFIYNAAIQKVKQYVDQMRGQVYYMHSCRTNLGPVRRDVNALWDLATHDIAIFNHLTGSTPEWVSAVASKVLLNGREDVGFISLGYPGNVLAHIHVSWADPNKARELVIVCSDKRIVFNDLSGMEQVRIFEKGIRPVIEEAATFGEFRLQVREGDIHSPRIPPSEPLKNQCRHFLECIENNSRPLTSGWDGLAVVRVLCAMDRSVALGGTKVEVEDYGPIKCTAHASAVC